MCLYISVQTHLIYNTKSEPTVNSGLWVTITPATAGDTGDEGSIPGLGRCPGGGHGNPLQCSCLENPMDREAWQAIVHGVAKSRTRQHTTAAADVSVWVQPQ